MSFSDLARNDLPTSSTSRLPVTVDVDRSSFVDNAKAIGIVLVVIGHAPAIPALADDFIFAFHMPLFFLLSGLLVDKRHLRLPVAARAAALARALLLPYLFFFLVSFVYWLVAKRHGLRAAEFEALPWWNPLIGLLDGTGDALYVNVVLWFLPCLFLVALLHHAVRKVLPARWTVLVASVIAFGFIVSRDADMPRWFWSFDCALAVLPFFAVGSASSDWLRRQAQRLGRIALASIGAIAALACLALTIGNGHIDVNQMRYGSHPTLFIPVATLGIAAALSFAALLPTTRVARWLSMNTLVIFPLHMLFFSVITGFAVRLLHLDPAFKTSSHWAVGILYAVLALALSYPASRLLVAAVPQLFARRRIQATRSRSTSELSSLRNAP